MLFLKIFLFDILTSELSQLRNYKIISVAIIPGSSHRLTGLICDVWVLSALVSLKFWTGVSLAFCSVKTHIDEIMFT